MSDNDMQKLPLTYDDETAGYTNRGATNDLEMGSTCPNGASAKPKNGAATGMNGSRGKRPHQKVEQMYVVNEAASPGTALQQARDLSEPQTLVGIMLCYSVSVFA